MEETPHRSSRILSHQAFLPVLALVCTSILTYFLLTQPWSLRQVSLPLAVGDVAPQDLRAPRGIQYVSTVLTDAARSAAERAVAPVYVSPDPAIARAQVASLNTILQSISSIHSDHTLTTDGKKAALAQIEGLSLDANTTNYLLGLADNRWTLVRSEALGLLGQAMRNPVRTEDLDTVRQELSSQVSFTLTVNEANLVVELVSPLIVANSFYSPELTDAARTAAGDAVQPISRSYVAGQTVVTRGQVITAADLEALTALGLVQPQDRLYTYLGALALVLLSAFLVIIYFSRRQPITVSDLRGLLLLALLFLVFLAGVRVTIPNRTVLPYLFPVPAFALLVSALFGMERGMVFGLLMSVLAAYGMPDSLALIPYYLLSSVFGVLALGQARRLSQFIFAALAIAAAGIAVVAAYRMPFTETDWVGLATLAGAALFMGLASTGLALPLHFLLAQFLGLTTALQLLEISRPDSPLLSYFLKRAPGTYQHCLQVANLAEQAAEQIHADALLTRVGALFHDIGKSLDPLFYVENQPPNQIDSHDELPPEKSAQTNIQQDNAGM
jgi:putative nucleotidyltransferase with HDIG domain